MIKKVLALSLICLLLTAMEPLAEESNKKDIVIDPKGVNQVKIELIFAAGKLNLSGGSEYLMEGQFYFCEKKPNVIYDPLGEKGYLYMKQSNEASIKKRSIWDVKLSSNIPMEMHVATGASEGKLDFRNMDLERLFIESGVGDTIIHLNGKYNSNFEGSIHTGVGNTKIYLPKHIGVIVRIQQDRGQIISDGLTEQRKNIFVNDVYGKAPVTIDLKVTMGIGEVQLLIAD